MHCEHAVRAITVDEVKPADDGEKTADGLVDEFSATSAPVPFRVAAPKSASVFRMIFSGVRDNRE
jgi:hypothetical protein